MRVIKAIEQPIGVVLKWVCIVLFAAMTFFVCYQVLVRQVLLPTHLITTSSFFAAPWTEAMGRYSFVWLGLLGAAYVIGENDDVAIDFLVQKFPAGVVRVVECIAHATVAFFAIWVMVIGGVDYVGRTLDQRVELLPFSKGELYSVLVIAGALIAFYSLMHIIETLLRPVQIKHADDEDIDITELQEEGI